MGNKIIKVLDNSAEKFGIAIDWSSENVLPYLQDLKLGDALELFKDIPDDSVDLIIADPPYNLGKNYGNNNDTKGFDEYLDFSRKWLTEVSNC